MRQWIFPDGEIVNDDLWGKSDIRCPRCQHLTSFKLAKALGGKCGKCHKQLMTIYNGGKRT